MSKKSPLIIAIEKIVDEKLKEKATLLAVGLKREDVIAIIAKQLGMGAPAKVKKAKAGANGGDEEPATNCPRGDHKYACPSKKCIEAGYVAA